jgi:lipopolysaccharide transport system permease protein/teichoic acid transport system permease protein
MRAAWNFAKRIVRYRSMIWAMSKRQIQTQYVGTLAGFVWTVVQPLSLILVYWLVFSWGLKVRAPGGAAFIVVFVCGLAPWLFFSEILGSTTNSIVANTNLVKKVVFPVEILPIVNITASLIGHLVMLSIVLILLIAHGVWPTIHAIQFFYLSLGVCALGLGMGWLTSAINVFYRDVGQIITVVLNMWFWLTPIVWPFDMIPEPYRMYAKLNPLYYLVTGYREALVYHRWIVLDVKLTLYFWFVCLVFLLLGTYVFRRLKREFADVL